MTYPIYIALVQTCAAIFVPSISYICPYTMCRCDIDSVQCAGLGLKELPEVQAANITKPLSLLLFDNLITQVPAGALPPRLSSIDFQENPITTIDTDAFNGSADTLTELWFSKALFTELPDAFLRLNNLTHLEISDTQVTSWNNEIIKHIGATLHILTLSNVGLTSWPTWIQYLPYLDTLELSSASFTVPDNAFATHTNTLLSLSLAHGILTDIPSAVSKLTQLQKLDLDNNNISRVTGIPQSAVLSTISMNGNKISDAAQLSNFLRSVAGSLKDLQLSNNMLTQLPDLSTMIKLDSLSLSSNPISYIGDSKISSSVTILHMELNNLQSLDSFIRDGLSLTEVRFQNNSINEIRGIDIPINVENMYISYNLLTKLTDESFPANSNMMILDLNFNPITEISSQAFATLSKLLFLSIASTKLTRLPLSLTYLTNARTINMVESQHLVCTCMEKEVFSWSQTHKTDIEGDCGVTTIHNFMTLMSAHCPD